MSNTRKSQKTNSLTSHNPSSENIHPSFKDVTSSSPSRIGPTSKTITTSCDEDAPRSPKPVLLSKAKEITKSFSGLRLNGQDPVSTDSVRNLCNNVSEEPKEAEYSPLTPFLKVKTISEESVQSMAPIEEKMDEKNDDALSDSISRLLDEVLLGKVEYTVAKRVVDSQSRNLAIRLCGKDVLNLMPIQCPFCGQFVSMKHRIPNFTFCYHTKCQKMELTRFSMYPEPNK